MMSDAFLHVHFLPLLGIPLGELWDLDALADDCLTAELVRLLLHVGAAQHAERSGVTPQRHRRPLTLNSSTPYSGSDAGSWVAVTGTALIQGIWLIGWRCSVRLSRRAGFAPYSRGSSSSPGSAAVAVRDRQHAAAERGVGGRDDGDRAVIRREHEQLAVGDAERDEVLGVNEARVVRQSDRHPPAE